jgi:hypothetical protein
MNGDSGTNGTGTKNNLNQSVIVSSDKQNMLVKNSGKQMNNTLNDSVVITGAGNSNKKESNVQ